MKSLRLLSKLRRYRHVLLTIFIVGYTLNIGLRYFALITKSVKSRDSQVRVNILKYNLMGTMGTKNYTSEHFRYNWLRMHRARTNWRAILRPCSDQMAWGTLKPGWGKVNRSSGKTSYIRHMDIQPSGQFSRIFIQTRTASGQEKTIGGDFWRVFFTGPANIAATVFDHQNGTYEAIALLVETGTYDVRAYLDYSLCDGLRDPPEEWFRIGNAQGKYQVAGTLGFLDEYLYEPLLGRAFISVEIWPSNSNAYVEHILNFKPSTGCKRTCRLLWDGHGRWIAARWSPYIPRRYERHATKSPRPPRGSLWIFGDSIGCRFYRSVAKKPLCHEIFSSCNCSYNWIYPVPNNNITLGRTLNDDFDFRPEIVLDSLRAVLNANIMKSPYSLLLLNFGLHYPISINFSTFQTLIDNVIRVLNNREKELGPRVIWKTTTSMHKENADPPRNITHFRFATEQRVRLFDAYAMWAMCNAGIEVLDVYPLSASYPQGTVDITHYNDGAFLAAEIELERYVLAQPRQKTKAVCMT